jgi:hypothetical protein
MRWLRCLAAALLCSCTPLPNITICGSNDTVTSTTMNAFSLTATIPLAGAP